MTAGAAGRFTATVRECLAGPVVEAAGELDHDSAPQLRAVLRRALAVRPAPAMLVVDLAGITFCDSSGLNTLLQARLDAERQDTAFHLARPTDIVARVLEITGTDQVFPVDQVVPAVVPRHGAG
ncbi:anti-sigma factor antagonist [Kitasatospora indigofera]|uniref:Anti-sigma factor antagonist n=1 Tax=Kitasatospora indigofera TaxID=67307 RepID=A0A919GBZ6_9ACTN|nr:STAS domain-containing protein [Kitasatospora indigofera]GHH81982.1 anti-sigma factor antagonist [Kitasatospora indigofera]